MNAICIGSTGLALSMGYLVPTFVLRCTMDRPNLACIIAGAVHAFFTVGAQHILEQHAFSRISSVAIALTAHTIGLAAAFIMHIRRENNLHREIEDREIEELMRRVDIILGAERKKV